MFTLELKDIKNGEIVSIGTKEVYNADSEKSIAQWLGGNGRGYTFIPTLKFSSGIKISHSGADGKIAEGALGTFSHTGNTVEHNAQNVLIMSGRFSHDGTKTTQIFPENLMQTVSLYSARKLITSNWMIKVDNYLVPNEEHELFAEYSFDSLIFSVFSIDSLQNSIKEKETGLEVRNQFFYLDRNPIKKIADSSSNEELFYDVSSGDKEAFVYTLINKLESSEDISFSAEAQKVLDLARELTLDSIPYRKSFNSDSPEYQINRWDAGWYQVRGLLDFIVENSLDSEIAEKYILFKEALNELKDKMTPMVYELGFLKK